MRTGILNTKLYKPTVRPNWIPRPRLVERCERGLKDGRRVLLLSAPAGSGKTTLLAEWLTHQNVSAAWLALDTGDNDPIRFWTHVIAALQTISSEFAKDVFASLQALETPPLDLVLADLLNEVANSSETRVFVLDDYHVISRPQIHETLAFVIDHLPPSLLLVIATRADPPLPLARLRVRNQLIELRAADLNFTIQETDAFLNKSMALDLNAQDVGTLDARTEGWIAGLQLAALALQGRSDRAALIRTFSGSHRHVLDYLGQEVLSRQSERVQNFLLKTSILERLCGSLCDAVLEETSSRVVLEALEQANLLLVPLDPERNWYRYHHLFADLLHARLRHTTNENEIAQLHRRAAQWHEQNDFPARAVEHALAARDMEDAARIVEQNTLALLTRGELAPLLTWVKLLPKVLVSERPWLCVEQAWALAMAGHTTDAAALLAQAEQLTTHAVAPERLAGHLAAQRAYLALVSSQTERAFELVNQADAILPQEEYWARTIVEWTRGNLLRARGELDDAANAFAEQMRLARACDNVWALQMAMHDLAVIYHVQGQLKRAATLFQDALDLFRAQGSENPGYASRVETAFASLWYEQDQLDRAQLHIASSMEKNRRWQNPNHIVFSQVLFARVLLAQGDLPGAQDALDDAHRVQQKTPLVWVMQTALDKAQVRLWIAQNNSQAIARWMQAQEPNLKEPAESREQQLVTRARVLIFQKKAKDAVPILAQIEKTARQSGRLSSWIEINVLQALAYSSKQEQAHRFLQQALTRGEREDFVRTFVDEGEPMRQLLTAYRAREKDAPHLYAYAGRLLDALSRTKPENPLYYQTTQPDTQATSEFSPLPELLSERELDVLRGLARGESYREIAEKLVVAPGTVKVHVHHLYGKLNAANRTQAIAHARELHLL